ncbi:hypothetical protein COHA_001397 [Chlorella ohadii]|uniref:Uncharacterized protein n=1 Tax=Chlorella ohadii TaxID=2649997 RepID=A0AAD5H5X4_9CHLO|nr:hypothetical protein COHA_001397 [Chlorella ohadii]
MLRAAAFWGYTNLLRLLLLLITPTAFMAALEGLPEVFEMAYTVFEVGQDINLSDLAWSPLHTAAAGGSTTCAAALLDTEPRLATLPTVNGFLPAHIAALHGHAEVLQLLLEGPEADAAGTQTEEGLLPLHCAAMDGRIECVRLLLGVAPASAAAQTDAGTTALHIASMCARPLGGGSDHAAVRAESCNGSLDRAFSDAVASHLPLSVAEWSLVPETCPGLSRALPAVLPHGHEQAGQLVRRLTQADKARLRTAALSMARMQKLARASLPPALFERIVAEMFTE